MFQLWLECRGISLEEYDDMPYWLKMEWMEKWEREITPSEDEM